MGPAIRAFSLYILTPLLSYLGGFYAYITTLQLIWNESLGGDFHAVLFYSLLAFCLIAIPIYLGMIVFVDNKFKNFKFIFYPLGCILVFFIPTFFIGLSLGSINIFIPEAMLFHAFYITSGLIFGLCTWIFKKIA